MLSAGNRAEVLVRAGRPGRYHLVLTPGSSQRPDIPGMPAAGGARPGPRAMGAMPGFPALQGELDPRTILTVEVAGHGPGHGPAHRPARPSTRRSCPSPAAASSRSPCRSRAGSS